MNPPQLPGRVKEHCGKSPLLMLSDHELRDLAIGCAPPYLPLQQGHFIRKVGDDQLFAENTGEQVAACGAHRCQHTAQQKSQPWPKQGTSQNILQRKQAPSRENTQPLRWACPGACVSALSLPVAFTAKAQGPS